MIKKILNFASLHKITSGFLAVALVFVGYYGYKAVKGNNQAISYALAVVEKGTIITSISGSGQVSALNQVDVKPKVSGDVVYVGVKNGQEVWAGALLVQLDTRDAQKAVRDAQINLENTQISLSKLQINQISDIPKLQDAITNVQNNLSQAYQNGFNEAANSFLDLPSILTGIRGILYDSTVGTPGQPNIGAYQNLMNQYDSKLLVMINQAVNNYLDSSTKYNKNFDDYKTTTRDSSTEQIVVLINETLETAKTMSQSVKDEQNILDAVVLNLNQSNRPIPKAITQYQSDIASYISKLNSHINSLTNIQNSIISNNQSLANSQRALETAKQFNPLDLASQQNALKQKEATLQDAKDNLADYYVRAPFAGIVGKINVKKGDSASGTVVATMLTKQKIAEVSLNEVDVSKVKIEQKVTLTFDAIDGLTITGEVLEIDASGTVSQGVVTYNVKIGFDTQDERVKPGMSVSAAIITNVKQNVLLVPNSAIKSSSGVSYIEVPANIPVARQLMANVALNAGVDLNSVPDRQEIELGLANDSETEIISGVNEGDLVIIRTISSSATSTTTQTRSLFPTTGGRTGGGATRIPAQ